jgi:hypothetical protein
MIMDDFVINVRQIGNYQQLQYIGATDLLLVQQGGIGGPYACVSQDGLLGQVYQRLNVGILPAPDNQGIASSYLITPLGQRQGFNWYTDEDGIQRYLQNGPAGYWSMVNTSGELIFATLPPGEKDDQIDTTQWNPIFDLTLDGHLTVGGIAISGPPSAPTDAATVAWVQANTVASFNGRIGPVTMTAADITGAGGAPAASPALTGVPTAPTATTGDSSTTIATTAFVAAAITAGFAGHVAVSSFNTRTGAVTLSAADVTGAGGALLASPAFTGTPTAPTPLAGNSSTDIATTAFVASSFATTAFVNSTFAPLTSPTFAGTPSAPTPAPGTSTGQLATTAFVQAAVVAATTGVVSFNTRTGAITLTGADVTAAGGALLLSPAFTGTPTGPTAPGGDSSTQLATTAFVEAEIASHVAGVSSFNGRTGSVTFTAGDITSVGGALLASPTFSGTPHAPTATAGDNSQQIATTAFVDGALANAVTSFNTRTGPVTLLANDISAVGGALLAAPHFTGVATAPTAVAGTNTTQLATTAFVAAAINTIGGVTSFNGRGGAITLLATDITGAGGAPLASPIFTGTPAAPTQTAGNNSTALATTAFVTAALAAAVISFNGRTGAVTLNTADLTSAGGALLASPVFTGVPAAPTAAPGTATTQLATTAFVQAFVPASVPSNVVTGVNADFSVSITLAAADNGKVKNCTAAGAVTVTCPNSLPLNFYCTIIQEAAGQITFAPGAGATVNNRQGLLHSAGQYAMCALYVRANTGGAAAAYVLGGDVA